MKRLLAALVLLPALAFAQTVPGSATVRWTLPTTTVDGLPLTGINALTSIQVFASTSPIADSSTAQPTATLVASAISTIQTVQVPNGGTIYVRVKACNAGGCSPFSAQATKLVQLDTKPSMPTNVIIELTIQS